MFNDLNATNNQNKSAVDDIFAETDKTSTMPLNNGGEIAAQKVGLAVDEDVAEKTSEAGLNNKWFKIILIVIVAVIIFLSAYLVYSKFFKTVSPVSTVDNNLNSPVITEINTQADLGTTNPTDQELGLVVPTSSNEVSLNSDPGNTNATSEIPIIPGVNEPAVNATSSETPTVSTPLLDSDLDGLTNAEEIDVYHTDPNKIDTDGDGLSDYEEVKIYHTDPNKADTDGDSYNDGIEVKTGNNPLGKGKMVDAASSTGLTQ